MTPIGEPSNLISGKVKRKKTHRILSRKEVHMMKTMMCLGGRQEKRESVQEVYGDYRSQEGI
jgi:hypothetical protein